MRHRELLEDIGQNSQHSTADLDGRGRALRKDKLINTGPRGIHAPHVTAPEAARILIACAGAKKATDAAQAVKTFERLKHISGKSPADAQSFGAALTAVLSDIYLSHKILEVRLGLPGKSTTLLDKPFGKIIWRDGGAALYRAGTSNEEDALFKHIGSLRMGVEAYIGGELIAFIAGKIEVADLEVLNETDIDKGNA